MTTIAITDASFQDDVLGATKPVLVDFWASWCGPCRQIAPSLDELSKELEDHLTIAKMDIDSNPATPGQYGVRGVPTLMIFKEGEMVGTSVGAKPKSQILGWINETLGLRGAAAS